MRRAVAPVLAMLLLTASLAKSQGVARSLQPPGPGRIGNPIASTGAAAGEAAAAVLLLSGLWPRTTWFLAIALFSLFSIVTAAETVQGKDSCGCFGAVRVKPIYTMCLDLAAVGALILTGKPEDGGSGVGRSGGRPL